VHADTTTLGGVKVGAAALALNVAGLGNVGFSLDLEGAQGPKGTAIGRGGYTAASRWVRLESGAFEVNGHDWHLARPASLRIDSTTTRLDSLVLRNADSAMIAFDVMAPDTGLAYGTLRARAVPLADVGVALQLRDPLSGRADAT